MTENSLVKIFEHNNWANQQILQACSALSDEQLDAEPQSATRGSIRLTLIHLVGAQQNYLALLTMPFVARPATRPAYAELQESMRLSGEGLLAVARGESSQPLSSRVQTRDGYLVEAWVIMVQAINHATEHREQIKSMLTSLGVTPPEIDGWSYGDAMQASKPIA